MRGVTPLERLDRLDIPTLSPIAGYRLKALVAYCSKDNPETTVKSKKN